MSNDLIRRDGNRLFVTSRDVAHRFGKKHYNVLRDIQALECTPEFRALNFELSSYITQQGKTQPMVEMTRDGFAFLCMGFTGHQAAVWKERYIAAFNAMERELSRPPVPAASLDATLSRLADGMENVDGKIGRMADCMAEYARTTGSDIRALARTQRVTLLQNTYLGRYVRSLEAGQQARARVTPKIREQILQMAREGMTFGDIGKLCRCSRTTVSLIVRGKYPQTNVTEEPELTVAGRLEAWAERERAAALAALEGLEERGDA